MNTTSVSRRMLVLGSAAFGASLLAPRHGRAAGRRLHVLKDPNCGCCTAWIEIVEKAGFTVTVEPARGDALTRHKLANGIPTEMMSCHTGEIDGYMIEGHVPVDDIERLLDERPDAVGLAVPGMPYGSPGMGPETEREAYAVHLVLRDGSTRVFSRYAAA